MNEYLLELGKGGAVACVAYCPCGTEAASQLLRKGVLDRVYLDGERVLGKAVFAAKCSVIARYPTQDSLYGPAVLWTLLGDPALRIKRPTLTGAGEHRARSAANPALAIEPNPARTNARVSYALPSAGRVCIRLFDFAGRLEKVLVDEQRAAGLYRTGLDLRGLRPGLHFLQLTIEGSRTVGEAQTRKLVIE
jgi:hypothetical protein